MVVKSDGSKWACQSCLKGHRVSSCTHVDRDLIHVPKKGRPVTQCQHCRQERKKRSAHVSCDCGEVEKPHHPKEKCIHLREAEERAKAGYNDESPTDKHSTHLAHAAEEQGCCCPHGGRCSCALLKREVDRDGTTPPHGPAVKPRLEQTRSDGSITLFQNGHHKPVHRKNHLAHESGMPYKMPMPRAHTDHHVAAKTRRSVDSLALDVAMPLTPSAFMPQTSAPFNTGRRMSKSEQQSPRLDPTLLGYPYINTQLQDMDFSSLADCQANQTLPTVTSEVFNFGHTGTTPPPQDDTFEAWSTFPSADSINMPNNNPFGVWPTNPDISGLAQPALTAASSNTQSEIDELAQFDENYGLAMVSMPSIQENLGGIEYTGLPDQAPSPSNRHSLPPNFFKDLTSDADWPFNQGGDVMDGQKLEPSQQATLDSIWRMDDNISISDTYNRSAASHMTTGRPSSRSVGTTFAPKPSNDVLQQFLSNVDTHGGYFTPNHIEQNSTNSDVKLASSTVNMSPTQSNMDFGPMNETTASATQAWPDGSMSIPNDDDYTDTFDGLDQEFSQAAFAEEWAQ